MSNETHVSALTDIYAAKISKLEKQNAEWKKVLKEQSAKVEALLFERDSLREQNAGLMELVRNLSNMVGPCQSKSRALEILNRAKAGGKP